MTKAQEMLELADCIDRVICNGVTLRDAPEMGKIGRLLRGLAAQADAPSRSVEIGPITVATNDTGAHFFPATADSSASVPQKSKQCGESCEFFDMLWKWFEDERRIGADGMRPERNEGLSADDFKTMLDEHEASLMDSRQEDNSR